MEGGLRDAAGADTDLLPKASRDLRASRLGVLRSTVVAQSGQVQGDQHDPKRAIGAAASARSSGIEHLGSHGETMKGHRVEWPGAR